MSYNINDYTFWGLSDNGLQEIKIMTSMAYLVALVDGPQNEITHLDKAKFILRYLFDVEEQVESAPELLSIQQRGSPNHYFPKPYYPQTPVMLTHEWSPIAAMLEHGWEPHFLAREQKRWSCASGIWEPKMVEEAKAREDCKTAEELFWHVLHAVAEKATSRRLLLSIIAMPGWCYESNLNRPYNITLAEAKKADRVIWQRTPRPK